MPCYSKTGCFSAGRQGPGRRSIPPSPARGIGSGGGPGDRLALVSVGSSKRDAKELSAANKVERVPTFVFFRGRKAIGRIVEKPKTTLEAEMAAIVAR